MSSSDSASTSNRARALLKWAPVPAVPALLLLQALGLINYPGGAAVFLAFDLSFIALALLIVFRPISYSYLFLAAFIVLGFWPKLMVHLISGQPYLEPIGAFDGSGESWDRALLASTAAALGLALPRALQILWWRRRHGSVGNQAERVVAPGWRGRWYSIAWSVTGVLAVAVLTWNARGAFHQIGVNPKLVLPLHLNVLLAWLINYGIPIWIAVLTGWTVHHSPRLLSRLMVVPCVLGLAANVSTMSRFAYLGYALPYAVFLVIRWGQVRPFLTRPRVAALAALFITCFACGTILVQLRRAQVYPIPAVLQGTPADGTPEERRSGLARLVTQPRAKMLRYMFGEIHRLIIDRWTGLEGVLAVSAHADKGFTLLQAGLLEDPRHGAGSIYQNIASAQYETNEGFTFLTLSGIAGLLFYSGAAWFVAAGMAIISIICLATEALARYVGSGEMLVSTVGIAVANVVAQTNFPYLTLVFFVELWATLTVLVLLRKLIGRSNLRAHH